MTPRDAIIQFITESLDSQYDPENDVLTQVLDSVSLLQLVVFLDQELGVQLDMSNLTLDAFASIDSLMATIDEQLGVDEKIAV